MEYTFPNGMHITFTDDDVVDIDAWIPADDSYNPYNVRPFAIGGEFGILAIVFASHESEAFDIAVDAGRLDGYMVADHDCEEECEHLLAGNASEAFDDSYLWIHEVPNPRMSFATLFGAMGVK